MDIEKLIKNLIQNETEREKRYILFMLLKFTGNLQYVETKTNELPLLMFQNGRFVLVYKDETIDDMEYFFTDYEEILIVLQKLFFEKKNIYFHCELPEKKLTNEEIWKKIDEALSKGDEESFHYYASKIK